MQIKPVRKDIVKYIKKRNLVKKFEKQKRIFLTNPRYPSLHTEVLEPKKLRIYSFRVDKK